MADWNNPTNTSAYETEVLSVLKDRDFDAVSLLLNAPTNPVDGMIKLLRSPIKFQERQSGAFVDLLLSIGGGGTGAATASDARTNLGLGTMAVQNSSAVSISGGVLAGSGSGLTNLNASNLASGTLPDARFPATLPALNGSLLTNLNGSAIASGTVPPARLGSGASIATKFLRGDSTWQSVTVFQSVEHYSGTIPGGGANSVAISIAASALAVVGDGIIIHTGGYIAAYNSGSLQFASSIWLRFNGAATVEAYIDNAGSDPNYLPVTVTFSILKWR